MGQPVILLVKDIFYPLVALFGVPANILTIVVLSRGAHGLSQGITRYMVAMAVADLLVLLFNVIVRQIVVFHFPSSVFFRTPYCRVNTFIKMVGLDCSVWFTVSFTLDRFVAICHHKVRVKYCSQRTAGAVILTVGVLFSLKNVPYFFLFEPHFVKDNVAWGCKAKAVFFTLPYWEAFSWVSSLTTPLLPFVLIISFNALTVRFILAASRRRRRLREGDAAVGRVGGDQDPEIKSRQRSVVLLFAISGSFVLLWTTVTVCFLITRVVEPRFTQTSYTDAGYVANESGRLLMLLSSCTNTCIYALTQSNFRRELKKIAMFPWNQVVRLAKR